MAIFRGVKMMNEWLPETPIPLIHPSPFLLSFTDLSTLEFCGPRIFHCRGREVNLRPYRILCLILKINLQKICWVCYCNITHYATAFLHTHTHTHTHTHKHIYKYMIHDSVTEFKTQRLILNF